MSFKYVCMSMDKFKTNRICTLQFLYQRHRCRDTRSTMNKGTEPLVDRAP